MIDFRVRIVVGLFWFLSLFPSKAFAGWQVDGQLGFGGVLSRTEAIEEYHNADNIEDIKLVADVQFGFFAPGPVGLFVATSPFSSETASHFRAGVKIKVNVSDRWRFVLGGGAGELGIHPIDPVTKRAEEGYHLKTIFSQISIDYKMAGPLYIGVTYFYAKANDPDTAVRDIPFSGSLQAAYFNLGYILPDGR